MSYSITLELAHGATTIAENIPTHAEAVNALKILFCVPGITFVSGTIWNTETGFNDTWVLNASGNPVRLSSNAAAPGVPEQRL